MSGGHFEHKDYILEYITDSIQELIDKNKTPNEWGDVRDYAKETIDAFKIAKCYLKMAQIYVHRIDYLVSGDDGEENFYRRLREDLARKI